MGLGLTLATAGIGAAANAISAKKARKNQEKRDDRARAENYRYSEMAAENANRRYQENRQQEYEWSLPENQIRNLIEAGLSPALIGAEGLGGLGGSVKGTAGGAQGDGAGAIQPAQEETAYEKKIANLQLAALTANISKIKSEIEVNETKAEEQKANAENKGAITQTENEIRPAKIRKEIEQGKAQWLQNLVTEWENRGGEGKEGIAKLDDLYGYMEINGESRTAKRINADITEAITRGELNKSLKEAAIAQEALLKEETRGYWIKLQQAAFQNDTERMKAEAVKLSAEWDTGEYTNWKTWFNAGESVAKFVAEGAKAIAIGKAGSKIKKK